jgi:hypothetical protein
MPTARTHYPDCKSRAVLSLHELLYHPDVADFFRCLTCRSLWHVPKGESGPASRSLLGNAKPEPEEMS